VAGPVAGQVEPYFPTVDVLDGRGVVGERAGDQVDQARLPDPGNAGDSLVDFFAETLRETLDEWSVSQATASRMTGSS
jgi:hypothetical protein